jgi:8-oxo-dGTP diphosphatase
MTEPVILVVACALIDADGRILICKRPANKAMPGLWEFPGGKIEPGETPHQALERELEEELEIHGAVGAEITRYEFAYPGKKPVLLIFLRVTNYSGEPRNVVFEEMRWEPPENLASFDFLEGDIDFIRSLGQAGCSRS